MKVTSNVMNYVLRRKGVGEKIGPIDDLSETGLKVIRSDRIPDTQGLGEAQYCFRWGTTATIPNGSVVVSVNEPSAIHWAYDKRTSRKQMADAGLAPRTWIDFGDLLEEKDSTGFHEFVEDVIVRPEHHIRSMDLNVCSCLTEVYRACQKYEKYYISEYINKDSEWRVFVVSGRVMAVVRKIPADASLVSWGCVDEGQFKYVPWNEWPLYVTQKAVQAMSMSGLDFGAVDVMSRSTGLPEPTAWVLEINTAPELTPYYLKSITKCFDYIVENGKGMIPVSNFNDWKNIIHPAISNMANV